jgi:hypothetical protein
LLGLFVGSLKLLGMFDGVLLGLESFFEGLIDGALEGSNDVFLIGECDG